MLGVELRRQLTSCRAATRVAATKLLLRPTLSRLQTTLCRAMTLDTSPNGPFNWVAGARCNPVDNVGSSANISPRTGSDKPSRLGRLSPEWREAGFSLGPLQL